MIGMLGAVFGPQTYRREAGVIDEHLQETRGNGAILNPDVSKNVPLGSSLVYFEKCITPYPNKPMPNTRQSLYQRLVLNFIPLIHPDQHDVALCKTYETMQERGKLRCRPLLLMDIKLIIAHYIVGGSVY